MRCSLKGQLGFIQGVLTHAHRSYSQLFRIVVPFPGWTSDSVWGCIMALSRVLIKDPTCPRVTADGLQIYHKH